MEYSLGSTAQESWTEGAYARTAINFVASIEDAISEQRSAVVRARENFEAELDRERKNFLGRLRRGRGKGGDSQSGERHLREVVEEQLYQEDEENQRAQHSADLELRFPLAYLSEEGENALGAYALLYLLRQNMDAIVRARTSEPSTYRAHISSSGNNNSNNNAIPHSINSGGDVENHEREIQDMIFGEAEDAEGACNRGHPRSLIVVGPSQSSLHACGDGEETLVKRKALVKATHAGAYLVPCPSADSIIAPVLPSRVVFAGTMASEEEGAELVKAERVNRVQRAECESPLEKNRGGHEALHCQAPSLTSSLPPWLAKIQDTPPALQFTLATLASRSDRVREFHVMREAYLLSQIAASLRVAESGPGQRDQQLSEALAALDDDAVIADALSVVTDAADVPKDEWERQLAELRQSTKTKLASLKEQTDLVESLLVAAVEGGKDRKQLSSAAAQKGMGNALLEPVSTPSAPVCFSAPARKDERVGRVSRSQVLRRTQTIISTLSPTCNLPYQEGASPGSAVDVDAVVTGCPTVTTLNHSQMRMWTESLMQSQSTSLLGGAHSGSKSRRASAVLFPSSPPLKENTTATAAGEMKDMMLVPLAGGVFEVIDLPREDDVVMDVDAAAAAATPRRQEEEALQRGSLAWYKKQVKRYLWPRDLEDHITHTLHAEIRPSCTTTATWRPLQLSAREVTASVRRADATDEEATSMRDGREENELVLGVHTTQDAQYAPPRSRTRIEYVLDVDQLLRHVLVDNESAVNADTTVEDGETFRSVAARTLRNRLTVLPHSGVRALLHVHGAGDFVAYQATLTSESAKES